MPRMDDDARLVRWKLQNFQLKGRYLFYAEPRPGSKPARLDLGDVMKIEIANRGAPGSPKPTREPTSPTPERKVLYIYVDSTRRHRLRELRSGGTPTIDEWLDALQEAMLKCKELAPPIAPPIADESSLAPAGAPAASARSPRRSCQGDRHASNAAACAGRDPPPAGPGFFFCACGE